MRKLGLVALILIILIIGASLVRDAIIKSSIESIVSLSTGQKIDIGELKVSVPKTYISIKDFFVLNPPQFNDKIMLDAPEIFIDYNLLAILKKQIHLNEVRINLKEFTIVKDKDGKTNLEYIKSLKEERDKKPKKDTQKPNLEIDNLSLKIGKVIYKDYSSGAVPTVTEYNINIDSRYKNLKNADEVIKIIIAKALINTAIGRLTDFSKFKDIPLETLEGGKDILKKTVDEFKDILKAPFKQENKNAQ